MADLFAYWDVVARSGYREYSIVVKAADDIHMTNNGVGLKGEERWLLQCRPEVGICGEAVFLEPSHDAFDVTRDGLGFLRE